MDKEPEDARSLRERLMALDRERDALLLTLRDLESHLVPARMQAPDFNRSAVAPASTPAEKIDLFRSLFAGRTEAFPVR